MTLTSDHFQFLFIYSENTPKVNVNGKWEIVPSVLFKLFFLPHLIGLEWTDIIRIFNITFKMLLSFNINSDSFRTITYFKLIKYITDKNIQFYIKATLRVSL